MAIEYTIASFSVLFLLYFIVYQNLQSYGPIHIFSTLYQQLNNNQGYGTAFVINQTNKQKVFAMFVLTNIWPMCSQFQ